MDKNDLLWGYFIEQRASGRAFDDQRTSIANFVITVSGVLIGFAATLGFSKASIIVYGFVTLLGGYGMAATRKLYESSSFTLRRAADCLSRVGADQGIPFGEIKEAALAKQHEHFRVMAHVRLHVVWMVLHGLILLFGIVGTGVSVYGAFFVAEG